MPFKPALTREQRMKVVTLVSKGHTKTSIANEFGVSVRTIHRIFGEEKESYRPQPCGTNAAYMRHLRNGEIACTPCLEAHAKEERGRNEQSNDR